MEKNFHIGIVVFPGVLQLDLTGPYGVFAAGAGASVDLVWKDTTPLASSDGLILTPTLTMCRCPRLDVLCVPGGGGILPLLEDEETLAFLKARGQDAAYITSVCTGALVLGAAGLLKGYKATTHWSSLDLLPLFGAVPIKRRVVRDGNRMTAAGVTSGIDMALTLAEELWGGDAARTIALNMEYEPEPPFASGSPETAPPNVLQNLSAKNAARQRERAEAASRAAARL